MSRKCHRWPRRIFHPPPGREAGVPRPISRRRVGPYIFGRGRRANAIAFKFRTSALMINEIYNRRILELAGSIPRLGRLPAPDASATAPSQPCGSTVTIDLKMDGDVVTDFA